jgi:hypothetical protein
MFKHLLIAAALVIAPVSVATAHGTQKHSAKSAKHAKAKHTRTSMHPQESLIDRCSHFRYQEKVNCLQAGRGGGQAMGATSSSAGGSVSTPSQPNETQPGMENR